ncbi:MAG: acetylxylan esterase [Acidobacteria bacterium]|nr:acetylxylan esterase [Acidobacteriota bacterium]
MPGPLSPQGTVQKHAVVLLAVALLGAPSLIAQAKPADPFLNWLDHLAQRQLDQRERAIAEIRTVAEANRRKQFVRQKLVEIVGGLPDYRGPLNARVTGRMVGEFHTIEKVIFESLPGFFVTGNLYRPNREGRYPAVLVPSGHTQEGKPEPQILAANLARNGFVVLTYDPIGQGEREQTYLPELGRPLSGGGGNEHLELGARSILIGQSVARYFIFDAQRAVDYLVSRPDVDADRIGVAGCSGGGAIATYVGVFDPRIKAAAPACFINSFRTLFSGPTADSEMSLPAFLASGLDVPDFFELAAPLPWLLLATTEDYFTPEGAKPVYEEVRRWYRLYGAEDRVRFFVGPGPHGMPKESREETYRWMTRWLKGGQGDVEDRPVKLYTNRELQVTASGHVDGEPGSRKLHQVILDEFRVHRKPRTVDALLAELRSRGVPSPGPAPAVMVTERIAGQNFRIERIRFEGEPGVVCHANLYLPDAPGRKPAVVLLEDKRLPVPLHVTRSPSTAPLAEAMVRAGRVVLELEPRDSPNANDGRPFLGNWVTNERVDLIGRNLAAMRAHDILVGVDVLAARPDVDATSIRGYARGVKGFWLMLAAAVDQRLNKIWLDRTPWSMAAALEGPLTSFLFDAMIPGFALHWDFKDLVSAIGDRRVLWSDPTNWMNQVVYSGPAYRYRHVGEPEIAYLDEFFQ